MSSDEFANAARPSHVPVRPNTDSYPVRARLVTLDGQETWTAATVVRHAAGHSMCRIPATPASPHPTGYVRATSDYIWLANDDIDGCQNNT